MSLTEQEWEDVQKEGLCERGLISLCLPSVCGFMGQCGKRWAM